MIHGPTAEGFNASMKNPCWSDASGQLFCLPYVLIAGSFHAGAGSLFNLLRHHPKIAIDGSSVNQFWGEEGKTMMDYRNGMRGAAARVAADPQQTIIMDGSQNTFPFYWANAGKAHRAFGKVVVPCWQRCTNTTRVPPQQFDNCMERYCLTAGREADRGQAKVAGIDFEQDQHLPLLVRAVYGERPPKMVLVLRDPVERLHSAYYGYAHYHGKYGDNPEGFKKYVEDQVGAFKSCTDLGHSARQCALYFETLAQDLEKVYFHCDQLMRGMYSVFLEVWLRFLSRENVLVINSQDYFANETAAVHRVLSFLGLPEASDADIANWRASNNVPRHVKGRVMLPEARAALQSFYEPFNEQLAKLLDDKAYLAWNARA